MHHLIVGILAGLGLALPSASHAAEGTVSFEVMTPETALAAAQAALENCRGSDYQVAVAVVDRFGGIQVVLRDLLAGARTVNTAVGKARTAVGFRTNTSDMVP
ncbi:MAG: heme-binding protein, partial [Arenicellales bacterium]|nr:heme-binding protein [Arenicellales bacterium]MEE1567912.1 heme-binding protein [Arenicellales bacterium]